MLNKVYTTLDRTRTYSTYCPQKANQILTQLDKGENRGERGRNEEGGKRERREERERERKRERKEGEKERGGREGR